jgi:hypothetical protein
MLAVHLGVLSLWEPRARGRTCTRMLLGCGMLWWLVVGISSVNFRTLLLYVVARALARRFACTLIDV